MNSIHFSQSETSFRPTYETELVQGPKEHNKVKSVTNCKRVKVTILRDIICPYVYVLTKEFSKACKCS